ncbi:MAG: DedA family protein [Burkholderiales bacterium]|nr:DedA family protein [Burkholderiales bacterium]OJX02315.1 MAG: hypothetical protein BGO72_01030 [Burkholderiales bacterium 70-64]
MDFSSLISQHGYWLLALGCFLEGETILVLAGFAAHQGYLSLSTVMLVAALAASAGDQCFFWLGRRHGAELFRRFPKVAAHAPKVHALLQRYDSWLIVGLRFAYGLRIAGPLVLGAAEIPAARFTLFNLFGAALWAGAIGTAGWFLGAAAQRVLGELRHAESWLFAAIVAAGACSWLYHRWRRR